jgi:hypothetical protein
MNAEQIKALLSIDLIVWDELAWLLEKHPEENLHAAGSTPWNSRDVYAHLARWLNRSSAHIEAYCNGKKLPEFPASPEEMNDIWQREDSSLTLAEARTKAGVALANRLAAVEAIPTDKWDTEMHRIVSFDGATHYAMHINYIVVNSRGKNPKH